MRHIGWLLDSAYDYYDLDLDKWSSYNALPIVDGQIRDVNRVWSDNLYMSYEEWVARFMVLRTKIITATY